MPRLRVLAGPSVHALVPITPNNHKPHTIVSDLFEGKVVVHIKNFLDEQGNYSDSEYFDRDDRRDVTWSIQVQGRFIQPISSDDILFGNTFERPLKLPWGAGAALRFMSFVDPTLEHDLTSGTRPWALSPLVATMPHFVHTPLDQGKPPSFPSHVSIKDDISQLKLGCPEPSQSRLTRRRRDPPILSTASKRRSYFSQQRNRKPVVFGPNDIITTDFCYDFITFPDLSLCLPGGISFDLTRYWDGQPVRFVCCKRPEEGQSPVDSRIFWCVAIERVEDFEDSSASEKGN